MKPLQVEFVLGITRDVTDLRAGNLYWDRLSVPEYWSLEEKALKEIEAFGVCSPFEKEYICQDGRRVPILRCQYPVVVVRERGGLKTSEMIT